MKWLDWLLRRTPPSQHTTPAASYREQRVVTDDDRKRLAEQMAAIDTITELLARTRRLGYDVDITIRRDASHD